MPPTLLAPDLPATAGMMYANIRIGPDVQDVVRVGTWDHVSGDWIDESLGAWIDESLGVWIERRQVYPAKILSMSPITRRVDDPLGGFSVLGDTEITLDNRDQWAAARGIWSCQSITIWRHDPSANVTVLEYDGLTDQVSLNGDWTMTLRLADRSLDTLDVMIPRRVATPELFGPTLPAESQGVVLQKIIGNVSRVKLLYVVNDVPASVFIYFVSEGAVSVSALRRNRIGSAQLQLMDRTEYSESTTLFPGMTVVTVLRQQAAAGGGFHDLYADVGGNPGERNPAHAFESIVSDPTWGLGQPVNRAALAAEAALIPAGLVVDAVLGGDGQQRAGREWLRQLLMVRGGWAELDAEHGWFAKWDSVEPATARMVIAESPDVGYTMLESGTVTTPGLEEPRAIQLRYGMNFHTGQYRYTTTERLVNFQRQRVLVLGDGERVSPSDVLQDRTSADMVAHYLRWRWIEGARQIDGITVNEQGRQARIVELVAVVSDALRIPLETLPPIVSWQILATSKAIGKNTFTLTQWNAARYVYDPEALPDLIDDDAVPGLPVVPFDSEDLARPKTASASHTFSGAEVEHLFSFTPTSGLASLVSHTVSVSDYSDFDSAPVVTNTGASIEILLRVKTAGGLGRTYTVAIHYR